MSKRNQNRRLAWWPSAYWGIAGASLWFGRHYWLEGQNGSDGAAIGAVVLVAVGVKNVFKGFKAFDQRADETKIAISTMTHTGTEGTAKWATPDNVRSEGMSRVGKGLPDDDLQYQISTEAWRVATGIWDKYAPALPRFIGQQYSRLKIRLKGNPRCQKIRLALHFIFKGSHSVRIQARAVCRQFRHEMNGDLTRVTNLFLGVHGGKRLYAETNTHLLTFAPPGAGKTTALVVNVLVTYTGSVIVHDIKGELYAMTVAYRRDVLGHRIIVLCPWAKKMSEALGIEIEDHGFNPLVFLKAGPEVKDHCELVSDMLLPGSAHMTDNDKFFRDGARDLLTGFLLHMLTIPEDQPLRLPRLRQYLYMPPADLEMVLEAMAQNPSFQGCIKENGGRLLGTLKKAPEQFEGWLGTAQRALSIYDNCGPLGAHVSVRTDIDFASLKTIPTTVYVMMPADKAATHGGWLNLVMSMAFERVGMDYSSRRVLFLMEEMANMGRLSSLVKALNLFRSHGVQIWLFVQHLGQLKRLYGAEDFETIMGTIHTINAFGLIDHETCRFISDWLGNGTVRNVTQDMKRDPDTNLLVSGITATDKAMPLLRPDEVHRLKSDQQIIFFKNLRPIRAWLLHYYNSPQLAKRVAPNPSRRWMSQK